MKSWKNMTEGERQAEREQVLNLKRKPCIVCGVNTLTYRKDGATKIPYCLAGHNSEELK
jgi:hypothetical protein